MSDKKRYRTPMAKEGELKMQYGKLPHNEPDHIILNGEGTNRRDARLLYNVMCSARGTNPPFIDVLAMRGYDVTTIKFSVSKLTTGE